MTLPLETAAVTDDYARRALDLIAQHFPILAADIGANQVTSGKLATGIVLELASTGTQRKVAFGAGSVTWTASVTSANATVAHGLGTTPVAVLTTGQSALNSFSVTAKDGTNITVQGFFTDNVARSGSGNFYWLAVG